MSKSDPGPPAKTSLRRSYERCLEARRQWISVRGRTSDDEVREAAHADLHETTLSWFEALVPYISERPGEVKQLWESAPLWPEEPATQTIDALLCPSDECGAVYERREGGGLEIAEECPACGERLHAGDAEVTVTTDEGRTMWEWACGLKRLASWTNETETVERTGGKWSTEREVVEVPKRLDPDVLLRAARFLDLAAEECGLLEETDRALPTAEL